MYSLNKIKFVLNEMVLFSTINPVNVPRKGDSIFFGKKEYNIKNVVWNIDDNEIIINLK